VVWIAPGCNPPDEWRLKYCVLLARFVTEKKTSSTDDKATISNNEEKSASKHEEADAPTAQNTTHQFPSNPRTLKRTQSEFTDEGVTKKPRFGRRVSSVQPQPLSQAVEVPRLDTDASPKSKLDMLEFLRERVPLERDWCLMSHLEQQDLICSRYKVYVLEQRGVFKFGWQTRVPMCDQVTTDDIEQSILKNECISSWAQNRREPIV